MYKGTFHCYFGKIQDYPFEQQTCSFSIYPYKSMGPFKLDAKNITVHPCIEPGMEVFAYKIVEWKMEAKTESKIVMSTFIFSTDTYLPTKVLLMGDQLCSLQ